jgi:hypothetical protein
MPIMPATWEMEIDRIAVQSQPIGKAETPSEKQQKAKRSGCAAQVVECLPSKCKALDSNPSNIQKKKK